MSEISDIYNSARRNAPVAPAPDPDAPPPVSTPDDLSTGHGASLKRAVVLGLLMILLLAAIAYIEALTDRKDRVRPSETDELELFQRDLDLDAEATL
ncbi:MAG TPA: hypothetical protein P5567_05615 [Kiritimatiellia bacterium]|nr:hypothetical protein [Kiritimatiellia bacterium]HRZ11916.1 hypothetical protein [Kiritimatiellia bacterium]HSA17278.1 hypothetical protein [Kiritimatiellia bacterium]